MSITTDNYFIALIVYHSLLIAHTPTVHSTFTDNCITLITWYRMAKIPCTWLHKVGVWMSSSTCCRCLEQGSMRRICSPIPCCTGQPRRVTVRWHVTSLQNSSWTHRTGTRCVECQETVLISKCNIYMCAWFSLCSEACCDKQVSHGQVYVLSCVVPSESYPTLCLLGGQFVNSARCPSVLV